ncbi:MAG: hypothetical protein AB1546_07175 [bacterium]
MDILNYIRNNYANSTSPDCSEQNCKLKLDRLKNYVVLKGEKLEQKSKICDCIIFAMEEQLIVGMVELKSRTIHVRELVEKLTNGTKIAFYILNKCNYTQKQFEFYHLVLAKHRHRADHNKLTRKEKVKIRGKEYKILSKKCGESFSTIIKQLQ